MDDSVLKSDEQKLEAFIMSFLQRILGIRWYDFLTNAEMVDRTQQESLTKTESTVSGVRSRPSSSKHNSSAYRTSSVHRRLVWSKVDGRPWWKQLRGRPRNTWVHQVELDLGMAGDTSRNSAMDLKGAYASSDFTALYKLFYLLTYLLTHLLTYDP